MHRHDEESPSEYLDAEADFDQPDPYDFEGPDFYYDPPFDPREDTYPGEDNL